MDRFLLFQILIVLSTMGTVYWLPSVSAQFVSLHSTVQESGRTHACPGEDVTYTCETNGSMLTWIVEPYVIEEDVVMSFLQTSTPGEAYVDPQEAIRLLIATTPNLLSEMSLRPSDGLKNTTVMCCANVNGNQCTGIQVTQEYLLSVPPQAPSNVRSNGSDGVEFENSDGFAYVEIEWDPPDNDDISHYDLVINYTDANGQRSTEKRVVEDYTYYVFSVDHRAFSSVTVDVTTVNECYQQSASSINITVEVNIRSITECGKCNASELGNPAITRPPSDERCLEMNAVGSVFIENGIVCYNGTSTGSIATYHCNTGYQLQNADQKRTCQSNASWTGSSYRAAPTCSQVSCLTAARVFFTIYAFVDAVVVIVAISYFVRCYRLSSQRSCLSLMCDVDGKSTRRAELALERARILVIIIPIYLIVPAVLYALLESYNESRPLCISSIFFSAVAIFVILLGSLFAAICGTFGGSIRSIRSKLYRYRRKSLDHDEYVKLCNEIDDYENLEQSEEQASNLEIYNANNTDRTKTTIISHGTQDVDLKKPEAVALALQLSKENEVLDEKLQSKCEENKKEASKVANKELNARQTDALNKRVEQQSGKHMGNFEKTLRKKLVDFEPIKMQHTIKEKELTEVVKELNEKSALVNQQQNELEELRQRFDRQQEEIRELAQENDVTQKCDPLEHNLQSETGFNLPRASRYYKCSDTGPPVPFINEVKILCFDSKGQQYTNNDHDITIVIPEGAIPPGQTVRLEVAVALHGPFCFPSDKRPISPILWICMQEDIKLLKPFEISLPHFLLGLTEDERKVLNVEFAKASHNVVFDPRSHQNMYQFQMCRCDGKTQFFSDESRSYGILKADHFCFICVEAKQDPVIAKRAGYSLTCIEYPLTESRSVFYFCVTFFLKSCLKVLKEQFLTKFGKVPEMTTLCFKFCEQDGSEPHLKMVYPTGYEDKCIIGSKPHSRKIKASEVDYWGMDKEKLRLMQDNSMHPPRLEMKVRMKRNVTDYILELEFQGCVDINEDSLNMEIMLPLDTETMLTSVASHSLASRKGGTVPRDEWHSVPKMARLTMEGHYHKLRSFLKRDAHLWRAIGLELGFFPNELNIIQSNPHLLMPTTSFLDRMLELWLQWAPDDGRGSKKFATFVDLKATLLNVEGMAVKAHDLEKALYILGGTEVQHQTYTILQPTPPDSVAQLPGYDTAVLGQLETTV